MNNSSVSNTRTTFRERATSATWATNPVLVAYIVYMLCLTAAVVL
ncbi:hypothetical protein BDZ31_002610 [Conexibacter arvalis]|uniref:Uncharacterized protein n=1 Tax=Conexibacter arvalis TaxID=912552 RepID=A0A840IFL7_9ACTN|nr:hypothetical protein [Conexibacter arvalis]